MQPFFFFFFFFKKHTRSMQPALFLQEAIPLCAGCIAYIFVLIISLHLAIAQAFSEPPGINELYAQN